jgi:hypothetical protein
MDIDLRLDAGKVEQASRLVDSGDNHRGAGGETNPPGLTADAEGFRREVAEGRVFREQPFEFGRR